MNAEAMPPPAMPAADARSPDRTSSSIPPRLAVAGLASPIAGPFDFALAAGQCLTITGASGSGKSLLLRMIADLDPNDGAVALDGRARAGMAAPAWRRLCPYVAATPGFWEATAADHFPADRRADARALAEAMRFDPTRFEAPIDRLSTGERQRVALARALLLDPPALLLDEPTGPLDREAADAVAALLAARLAKGMALLLVTHDDRLAERFGGERRVMRDRRFAA